MFQNVSQTRAKGIIKNTKIINQHLYYNNQLYCIEKFCVAKIEKNRINNYTIRILAYQKFTISELYTISKQTTIFSWALNGENYTILFHLDQHGSCPGH